MAHPDVGDAAPDFELARESSEALTLGSLAGRKAVLYFYPKDDTSGCTVEAVDFSRLKPDFEKGETAVIGISPDSVKSHAKFRAKHGLAVDLASDEGKQALEAFGVWAEKSMYGRKYMGVERTTFLIGPDGRIARIWRKVAVKGHAEEVLEAARAL